MIQPKRVLDMCCKAGGAAMGLHRAWPDAHIVGVDIEPQPRYPFKFVQRDLKTITQAELQSFDFIWASPPCQKYSAGRYWARGHGKVSQHPDLIDIVRSKISNLRISWVIENVPGAPLYNPVMLCGSMFKMRIEKGYLRRHRLFELNFGIVPQRCHHQGTALSVCGHGAGGLWDYRKVNAAQARQLMDIDWMTREEVNQAVPPAYSEYIAHQWSLAQAAKIVAD